MSDNFRSQIYPTLRAKETDDLLEIWQNGNVDEWDPIVFEIIEEILMDRLGYLPPQSPRRQVTLILNIVDNYLEADDYQNALSECDLAIQLMPEYANSYNFRGVIYGEMGQLEEAIDNFQVAIQLDPNLKDAWDNMLDVEKYIEDTFQESKAKQHLDNALQFTNNDEPEKALAECELAKLNLPNIAGAYNYLGMILEGLEQLEPAIDAYLKAIQLNPRFYAARENLGNARKRLEEDLYHQIAMEIKNNELNGIEIPTEFDESSIPGISDGALLPQWLYLDEKAFLLTGWAGHRTRQGRSGYDPLETDFENAHIQGVIIRKLITLKFRTRNPIYLFFMTIVGLIFSWPLIGLTGLIQLDGISFAFSIFLSPYWIVGILLLINVYLSLRLEKSEELDENGYPFF